MKRSVWILIAILAALVLAAVLVLQQPGETSSTGDSGETLVRFDSSKVDKLEIRSNFVTVVLQKEGAQWMVTSPLRSPADESAVTTAIGKGAAISLKALVSSNPQKQTLFQVDSTSTLVRVFENNEEKAVFRVGKAGPTYTETYVRKEGSNDVHLAEGMLSYVFSKTVRDWRDKTIFKTPQETLKEVRFHYGDTTFVLSMPDSAWRVDGQPTQEYAVKGFLSAISNLTADEFIDSAVTVLPPLSAFIEVGGTQIRFFFDKASNNYYVSTSRTAQVFQIQNWRATQLLKRKKDFLATPA